MTVLNSYSCVDEFVGLIIMCFLLGGLVGCLIGCLIDLLSDSVDLSLMDIVLITLLFAILGGSIYGICDNPSTRYEVVLDDSYSANEFLNQYTIIDQRGDIYVVEEKSAK